MIEQVFAVVARVSSAGHMQPAKVIRAQDILRTGLAENDPGGGQLGISRILRQDMRTRIGNDELVVLGFRPQQLEFRFR